MEAFVAVAGAGGFTAAAARLGSSTSQLSRRVTELETRLGARLFHRTTRALALTEAGAAYLEAATRLLDDARAADEAVAGLRGALTGSIRLSAPLSFGTEHLAPVLNEFMVRHPALSVDLLLDDRSVDLVGEGVDIGLRVSATMADSGLISRVLRPVARVIVGSPAYLDAHGRPERPEALAGHVCLLYRNLAVADQWRFSTPDGVRQFRGPERLRADNGTVMLGAAIAGLGLAELPDFIVDHALADGRLER
ncbi:MAG TPA: LysR substrate-binding domain-containing protein, partial [Polymorphobacter sp.]|nr:LysR substrate-binding domain-containing protein [Polymorphobacter sp.]